MLRCYLPVCSDVGGVLMKVSCASRVSTKVLREFWSYGILGVYRGGGVVSIDFEIFELLGV